MLQKLDRLSLIAKIAAFMIAINIAGIAALATYTWSSETRTALAAGLDKWTRDTEQFATISAGGIKWNKPDVVRESYALFRDDPTLNLVHFSAYNRDGELVDSWTRDTATTVPAAGEIATFAKANAEAEAAATTTGPGVAMIAHPLGKNAAGQPSGEVVTIWTTEPIYAQAQANAIALFAIQAVMVGVAFLLLMVVLRRLITRPLSAMTLSIGRMQEGDFNTEVPLQEKGDEIGVVARALETFRGRFIATREESRLAEEQRLGFEAERSENAKRSMDAAQIQARAIDHLAQALERLAEGDFTCHLDDLGPEFEKLVADFNRMVGSVSATLNDVKGATSAVEEGSSELANSADTLASRTEQTAASLEETAAALHQMTATVRESSDRAEEAGQLVNKTKQDAASSASVVREAISAMDRIQKSSSEISQIISVIDEIAFQTNLLALNAGVEAARAGEAGQGFAVVAHEVRELAQRSAQAAKEISKLIGESGREVKTGVDLVNRTAESLLAIEGQVNEITSRIQSVIGGYREQSTGLDEINTAVVSMDQATQQNAAMVEETNAACQELRAQGSKLNRIVARFRIAGMATAAAEPARREPARAAATKSAPRARPAPMPARRAVAGNTALAQDDWEEF